LHDDPVGVIDSDRPAGLQIIDLDGRAGISLLGRAEGANYRCKVPNDEHEGADYVKIE
jgi:hypothetical protein